MTAWFSLARVSFIERIVRSVQTGRVRVLLALMLVLLAGAAALVFFAPPL